MLGPHELGTGGGGPAIEDPSGGGEDGCDEGNDPCVIAHRDSICILSSSQLFHMTFT